MGVGCIAEADTPRPSRSASDRGQAGLGEQRCRLWERVRPRRSQPAAPGQDWADTEEAGEDQPVRMFGDSRGYGVVLLAELAVEQLRSR
jgi:hypothetical protein